MKSYASIYNAFSFRLIKVSLSLICLLVGGLIYLGYRTSNLLMFQWIDALHLNNVLSNIRKTASYIYLSEGIIYNLPSCLWLFSYMFLIDAIWGKERNKEFKIYLYSIPILSIIAEVLQLFGILGGTFDIMDMIGYFGAILLFETLKLIDK